MDVIGWLRSIVVPRRENGDTVEKRRDVIYEESMPRS